MKMPIQPIKEDERGVLRFVGNSIVRKLLDDGQFDMNHIAEWDATNEEREQFAQLIGYSVSGFGDLSYVSDETLAAAEKMAAGESNEYKARYEALCETLEEVRRGMKIVVPALYSVHPDDLDTEFNSA